MCTQRVLVEGFAVVLEYTCGTQIRYSANGCSKVIILTVVVVMKKVVILAAECGNVVSVCGC